MINQLKKKHPELTARQLWTIYLLCFVHEISPDDAIKNHQEMYEQLTAQGKGLA
jgi:hypothetical protein